MQRPGNFVAGFLSSPTRSSPAPAEGRSPHGGAAPGSRSSAPNPYSEHAKGPFRRRKRGVATDLTLIKGILSKALAHKGIDKKMERYEFILHWEEIVGAKLAEVSKPEYISRKTLLVRVLHPVWAQEFTFMKPHLLRQLLP
jgi:predicted nucleic acid-binding Zn ribbon protein